MDELNKLQDEIMQALMKASIDNARFNINAAGELEVEYPQPILVKKGDNWYIQLYFP